MMYNQNKIVHNKTECISYRLYRTVASPKQWIHRDAIMPQQGRLNVLDLGFQYW